MALPSNPQVVITGAASGFGRALALELAGRNAKLVLADLNLDGAEETARLALERGASFARAVRCDVTQLEDLEALERSCEGQIDLVINNAGVSSAGKIGELPMEDWRWTLNVDLFGVLHGCHVFVPRLRRQGCGHVLNVASAAGLLCAPTMGAYNVAKAGVIALSETLASELAGTGIGVTVTCPTFFKTKIVESGRFTSPVLRESGQKLVARGKDAQDVARAALSAVEKGTLYSLPMADGRWFWRLKRLAPGPFNGLVAKLGERLEGKR